MKRSVGIVLLTIGLIMLSFAGFSIGYSDINKPGYGNLANSISSIIYGIAASATAIGLWLRKQWAFYCYLLWCVTVFLGMLISQLYFKPVSSLLEFFIAGIAVPFCILYFIGKYIKKVTG
jgi:uncharacterized membrane protein (DUF2068 family)